MMKIRLLLRMLAISAMLCTVMLSPALADTITYFINVPDSAISGYTGPYASVLVNRTDATHATITFTGLTDGIHQFLMGGTNAVDVNVNASSWTVGSISIANSLSGGFTPGPLSSGGAGNIGSFGIFNQTFVSFDGYTHSGTSASFILTDTGGTWSTASNVLTANAGGFLAGAHIFVNPNLTGLSTDGALATGFGANGGGTTPVPEPGTMLLLGSGLVGLAGWGRKKFRK